MTASLFGDNVEAADEGAFHNHPLLPVIITFLILTYVTVTLRLWTRARYVKFFGWDDFMIVVALVFFTVYCGSAIAMFIISNGALGIAQIPAQHLRTSIRLLLVEEVLYILTMMALKVSLAIFFLRILAAQWQRYVVLIVVGVSTIFGVAYLFFAIFQCGWFTSIDVFIARLVSGQCASEAVGLGINYTYAALGTLSDWTCGLVPVFILRGNNMPKKAKLIVCGLLAFAAIGSVASIVRMVYLHTITTPTGDFFKNASNLAVWSTVEPGIGITVSNLAISRRFFQKLGETTSRLFSSRRSSSGRDVLRQSTAIVVTQSGESVEEEKGRRTADEMRAYGMPDFEHCVNVPRADLENAAPGPE